jgi:hypothetical protein
MKLQKPDGGILDASISKGRNIVLSYIEPSTGAKSRAKLDDYIKKNKEKYKLEDCEIIEATDQERKLLKEFQFNFKGL